jgi:hypothetical protein
MSETEVLQKLNEISDQLVLVLGNVNSRMDRIEDRLVKVESIPPTHPTQASNAASAAESIRPLLAPAVSTSRTNLVSAVTLLAIFVVTMANNCTWRPPSSGPAPVPSPPPHAP